MATSPGEYQLSETELHEPMRVKVPVRCVHYMYRTICNSVSSENNRSRLLRNSGSITSQITTRSRCRQSQPRLLASTCMEVAHFSSNSACFEGVRVSEVGPGEDNVKANMLAGFDFDQIN